MTDPTKTAWPVHLLEGLPALACVDIGGTKVSVVIATPHGMKGRVIEPTQKQGGSAALAQQILRMLGTSSTAAGMAPSDVAAVGVSSCGPFVKLDGSIALAAPNICGGLAGAERGLPNDWVAAPIEAPLREHFARVQVRGDGIAALEAERRWGALQDKGVAMDHCAYVTWSTGIGVGVCADGHVLLGKNGNAGHAGHVFVSSGVDALCGCGLRGDVEALIAGNAIARRFAAHGFADAAALFDAARSGDALAAELVDQLCDTMGRMLFGLVATLDLERISMGGSVFWHQQDLLLPRLRAFLDGKLPPLTRGCDLVPAGLGQAVGDWAAFAVAISAARLSP
ncbi:MAG: hypothetical protein RLZZ126_143 [Pseudomonadota bacterium]|jgi:glucokinase